MRTEQVLIQFLLQEKPSGKEWVILPHPGDQLRIGGTGSNLHLDFVKAKSKPLISSWRVANERKMRRTPFVLDLEEVRRQPRAVFLLQQTPEANQALHAVDMVQPGIQPHPPYLTEAALKLCLRRDHFRAIVQIPPVIGEGHDTLLIARQIGKA
jgi:hypothetical protein